MGRPNISLISAGYNNILNEIGEEELIMKTLKKQGQFLVCFTLLGLVPCISMASPKKQTSHKKKVALSKKKMNAKSKVKNGTKVDKLKSYIIKGKRYYVMKTAKGFDKVGEASWYGKGFHGKLTASGERYNQYAMTAASPHLPLPTYLKVTNLSNGKSVVVKVTDRGPYKSNRMLDLSYAAAKALGYEKKGVTRVRATVVNKTELAQNETSFKDRQSKTLVS